MNQQYNNNPFAGMTSGDQSIGVRYPFLDDGDYKLKIHKVLLRGRKKPLPFYVIEHEVIESNVPTRPPGSRNVSMIDLNNRDMRGKNTTSFLCAVFGVDPTQLPKDSAVAPWVDQGSGRNVEWGEYANWSVQESNPLAGATVGCRVQTIQTQESGEDFSVHSWVPMSMMTIGAMRQAQAPRQQLPQGPAPAGAGNWGPPGAGQMPQQPQGGGWGPPQQPGQVPGNGAAPAWGPPAGAQAQPPQQQPQQPAFGPPGQPAAPQHGFQQPAQGGAPTGPAWSPAAPAQQPGFGPPPQGGFGPGPGGPGGPPWGGGQGR